MKNFNQTYINNTFCTYFPHMIRNNMDNHELYFMTVTFEDQFLIYDSSMCGKYFKSFYQKVNQYTINRTTLNKHLKCKMVFIPEHSYNTRKKNLNRLCHYHGFVMINKEVDEKFKNKCIKHTYYDNGKCKSYDNDGSKNLRTKALLNPGLFYRQNSNTIKHHSIDFQLIGNDTGAVSNICGYMTKNLGNWYDKQCNFNLSDINAGNSSRDERINIKPIDKNGFSYEDVLFFGDISQTDVTKYKPINIRTSCKYPKILDKSLPQTPFRQMMQKQQREWLGRFYDERR